MSPDELAAWVARSRAAQGLPEKVTDPAALRQVAVLVSGRSGNSGVPPEGPRTDCEASAPADGAAS